MEPRQGSDTMLIYVSVARPLFKLMGYEHREVQWGREVQARAKHTHTHSASVIHRVDEASGKDRTQS